MNTKTVPKITSQCQFEELVRFMEANVGIARGYNSTNDGKKESKKQWEVLSNRLNVLGPPIRTETEWRRVWADLKQNIKKKLRLNERRMKGTGGGLNKTIVLTPMEQKVDEICCLVESIHGETATKIFGVPANKRQKVSVDELTASTGQKSISNSAESLLAVLDSPDRNLFLPQLISDEELDRSSTQQIRVILVPELDLPALEISTPRRTTRNNKTSRQLKMDLLQNQVKIQEATYEKLLQSLEENKNVSEKLLAAQLDSNKIKIDLLAVKKERLHLMKEERLNKMKRHADKIEFKLKLLDIEKQKLNSI